MKPSSLRSRIRQHRQGSSRPRRYPEALRRDIASHVRWRRSQGESIEAVARSLGMSPFTLYAWVRADTPPRRGFRRVDVVPRTAEPVTLTTPQGYRLEGDAASLAAVLKALL